MSKFASEFHDVGECALPKFTGLRVMMMPFHIGHPSSLPCALDGYKPVVERLYDLWPKHGGDVGYLTVDERRVPAGHAHRRPGLHVDGVYGNSVGSWAPSPPGPWGSQTGGMLTVASNVGCRAWRGSFNGEIGADGDCGQLSSQLGEATEFKANRVYWVGGFCIHESIPLAVETERQFVRVSMPSEAPWFDGYTRNPLGVESTGPILSFRNQMDYAK